MIQAYTPPSFFEIDKWKQWTVKFFSWLDKDVSPDVLARFHAGVDPTWIEWLDEQQAAVERDRVDCVERFTAELTEAYDGIRVFHATRQHSLENIALHGLRAWSVDDLIRQEQERFGKRVDPQRLEAAIARSNPEHRAGRVYTFSSLGAALSSPSEDAPGRIPEFAELGGEFHRAVSMTLGIADQAESMLAPRGYLLACDLPWELLDARSIGALAADALRSVLTCRFLDPFSYNMLGQAQSLAIERDIPPQAITLAADVEALVGRDIRTADIAWICFPHER